MDDRLIRTVVPVVAVCCAAIVVAGFFGWFRLAAYGRLAPVTPIVQTENSEPPVEEQVILQPSVSSSVRLLFIGDIMLDRNVATRSRVVNDLAYPFKKLPIDWLGSFDYTVANLEGSVTDKRRPPEKSIDFQFDPGVAEMLKDQGIDAFSQANNHALDQGALGYEDSVKRLRAAGFLVFGHQVRDDQAALATTTIKGMKFAFLGFNITDNSLDVASAQRVIASARAEADQVIVYMHWGAEYRHTPHLEQVQLAHWFIDQGVDVVMGGHAHWVQGIESYKGKPIVYSLGNFVFDQDFSKETTQGMAVELEFSKAGLTLRPFPTDLIASQVSLVEARKATRLNELASYSRIPLSLVATPASVMTDILSGTIFFPR